ncbi:ankyrin repeat domain-containing protein [Methanolobus sediminis]|uniref:Ankyrin repeat domain-containing protein n=1 Tax=Methanolobus sediminis TaxID=3072978 RepID=A0AA51YMZ6_9EURY|nr:ankyrin repeat domain-containing protein [Methanolobus sediminis]WMW26397.1 ankyrin repeat domain-containing protein [Methanolobus sediminis]
MKYLFDTNVLLKNPALLRDYSDSVVISPTVFDELDYRKRFPEHQENSQLSIKHINHYRIKILEKSNSNSKSSNDQKIVNEVLAYKIDQISIVSDDEGVHVLARNKNIRCISLAAFQKEMLDLTDVPNENDITFFKMVQEGKLKTATDYHTSHKINPNFIGEDNLTPLIHFVRKRDFEKVKYWSSLQSCDLDKYDKGKFPMPPFMHASQRGWLKGLRYLIEKGANPHLLSIGKNKGNSALLIAVWDGRYDIVEYLIENKNLKISINQVDGNGFTPMMKAAIKGQTKIAYYLAKHPGLDLLIRDRNSKSALDHAQENGHSEIEKIIKEYNHNDQ